MRKTPLARLAQQLFLTIVRLKLHLQVMHRKPPFGDIRTAFNFCG
jgi:hypothetical protein